MSGPPCASPWDALWAMLWPFGGKPPVCMDCGARLEGPEVYIGAGTIRRNHFGDRCWPCEMKRYRRDVIDSWLRRMSESPVA